MRTVHRILATKTFLRDSSALKICTSDEGIVDVSLPQFIKLALCVDILLFQLQKLQKFLLGDNEIELVEGVSN